MSKIIDEILLIVSTPHPLNIMSEEELFSYGELCHNYIFLDTFHNIINKGDASDNLFILIRECMKRLRSNRLDLLKQSLLQRRLIQWTTLIGDEDTIDEAKELAVPFLRKAEKAYFAPWEVLYSCVLMSWSMWGNPECKWAETVKKNWRAAANDCWKRETLDFEQSKMRVLVSIIQDKDLNDKIEAYYLKGESPELMQKRIWRKFRFMPLQLLPFPKLMALAEKELAKNQVSNALRYQIYASLLLSLNSYTPWPNEIADRLCLPVEVFEG